MILFRYLENIVKKTSDHFSLFKGKTERREREGEGGGSQREQAFKQAGGLVSHGTERNDQMETSIIRLKETKCSEYLKIFETSAKAPSVCKRVNN